MLYEDDDEEEGIPVGWWDVHLTEDELDRMVAAADRGHMELAEAIVEDAYHRLYAELGTDILRRELV